MSGQTTPLSRVCLIQRMCWVLVLGGYVALYPLQREINRKLETSGEIGDVLYIPSGKILRRMTMGHEGLLANIYWTRVVQYFGRRRLSHATRYELLGPFLRITTDLDPQLLTAYRFGAVFLAEKAPDGAGQPEEALQLLRRGIVANPDYWRLWQDLGFIYYWDLKDYPNAARVFKAGSERPGAMIWMKALAATVSAQGGESRTSRLLWSEIYRNADNEQIRKSAQDHLAALETQETIEKLNKLLARYRAREGHAAGSIRELVAAGYLSSVPRDLSGAPFIVGSDDRATLAPQSKINLQLLQ